MPRGLGHYQLPNAQPPGTHRTSNAQGLPGGGGGVAGIDLHISLYIAYVWEYPLGNVHVVFVLYS